MEPMTKVLATGLEVSAALLSLVHHSSMRERLAARVLPARLREGRITTFWVSIIGS
jgi:hypothetical protein